jgi:hypothetical protein
MKTTVLLSAVALAVLVAAPAVAKSRTQHRAARFRPNRTARSCALPCERFTSALAGISCITRGQG